MESNEHPDESEQLNPEDIAGFIEEWDLNEGDLTHQQIEIAIKTGHY